MVRSYALANLLLLLGSSISIAGPLERDAWHAFVADGKRYGYQHVVVSELADGNFRYSIDVRVLLDLFGMQKQEITQQADYVVTPTYRPVSCMMKGTQMSGPVHSEGRVHDGKLLITSSQVGVERNSEIDLSAAYLLDVCLEDWLNDQVCGGVTGEGVQGSRGRGVQGGGLGGDPRTLESSNPGTLRVELISTETWEAQSTKLTRQRQDESGSVWLIETADGSLGGRIYFDARGMMRETKLDVPRLHLKRCTADEARDIDYRDYSGRSVLMFPVDKDIPAPHRLASLTVKLTWESIPFDQFNLQDDRQRVVSRSQPNGHYEAVVEIGQAEPVTAMLPYPIEGTEFAPYLAETRFIKPRHAGIVDAARRIVDDRKSAIEAVRALSTWVSGYIEGGMVAETLSGPQVLQCRKGKCSEYATLFASLARSVGIPTRIVLGERIGSGYWAGHMWNEAYVGRWIPVDASVNEVGQSFALLKLVHSDTVAGTQPLRWSLTDSLDISIQDFKTVVGESPDRAKPVLKGRVYTDAEHSCRVTLPVDDWSIDLKDRLGGTSIVRFTIPGHDDVKIHLVAFPMPPNSPPKRVIDTRLSFFRSRYKDFAVLKNEPCRVTGVEGHMLRFRRAPSEDEPGTMLTTEFVWGRGRVGYLLNLIAEESAHQEYLPPYDKLLSSFEFLDP